MRTSTKLLLLLLIAGLAPQAFAQAPGNCRTGQAISFMSINDVQASVFNTGGLFFGGSTTSGNGYLVPKASGNSPIFASGVWVGGTVNGERRVAAARYGNYNFWPGPLDETTGRPVNPNDCAEFDRIYNVTRQQIADFESGLAPARDLADWPVELGAPVIDGDGDPTNYNLSGGDRPEIIGDQGIWWVMNDVGNEHPATGSTAPMGIEVQVLAWAFARADALGQTTFYRYRIINKGPNPIENTYISVFSDPDLGDAGDDYVGIDTTISLGFVYNDGPEDASYGIPPAAGYDFFQGPIVDGDTLGATSFTTFINGGPSGTTDPGTAEEYYNYMQGLWGDGTPITAFGQGYQTAGQVTRFVYPGDPVTEEFWSELNTDGSGSDSPPGDRRLVVSTGPFTLLRNDPQDIVFGVVFAQGTDYLSSISALRTADVLAQTAYDVDFQLAPPPPPPPLCNANSPNPQLRPGSGNCLEAVSLDGKATLVWGYPTSSSNYLGRFEVEDALLQGDDDVSDSTYDFEGFNIYRYPTSNFAVDQRQLVATFDKANGVTTVIDQVGDADTGGLVPRVVARGSDSGLQYSFDLPNLTNNTDYFYGITAYSYNEESTPKVIESSATQITVRPSRLTRGDLTRSDFGQVLESTVVTQAGQGSVSASVVDPTQLTGGTYEVRFYSATNEDGEETDVTTYNVVDADSGEILVNGQDYYDDSGQALPLGRNVFVAGGLSFNIEGPQPGFEEFLVTANANGPIVPATGGSADFQDYPVPNRPGEEQQVGPAIWFFTVGGGDNGDFTDFNNRVARGDNFSRIGAFDYEMRFTGSSTAYRRFQDDALIEVPFEIWNTGVGTPEDTSDDYRMVPAILDQAFGDIGEAGVYDLSLSDDPISGAANDPETDWIYWYNPNDTSPGEAGYEAWLATADTAPADHGGEVLARTTLVGWNLGTAPPYPQALPEEGTVFRIITTKPNQPGDVFAVNTQDLDVEESGIETPEEALDRIAMVPNPYMGASTYETGNLSRVVRITNLPPDAATIQIYTVAGSLVRTLRKDGPSRSLDWDLQTETGLPVASGMYLVRIEIADVGERILKFGVVNRKTQITLF